MNSKVAAGSDVNGDLRDSGVRTRQDELSAYSRVSLRPPATTSESGTESPDSVIFGSKRDTA